MPDGSDLGGPQFAKERERKVITVIEIIEVIEKVIEICTINEPVEPFRSSGENRGTRLA
jgi:hypothetical protein